MSIPRGSAGGVLSRERTLGASLARHLRVETQPPPRRRPKQQPPELRIEISQSDSIWPTRGYAHQQRSARDSGNWTPRTLAATIGAAMARTPKSRNSSDGSTRNLLAVGIVGVSVAGITVIAVAAIAFAGAKNRPETSRLVFTAVLPLFGTWVGTVLAFYFARDNLQAATESTLRLSGINDPAKPVTSVMIPESDWVAYSVKDAAEAGAALLKDLHAKMNELKPPSRRLPIRTDVGTVLYVLHDATLTAFAEQHEPKPGELTKTFGDLLSLPQYKQLVEAIGFVSGKSTISDARTAMTSTRDCNDVFVTSGGNRDEHAIGWLTNTLLAGVQ